MPIYALSLLMLMCGTDPGSATMSTETMTIVQCLSDQRKIFDLDGIQRQGNKKMEDMLSERYHAACNLSFKLIEQYSSHNFK
jgi:hypothetical protein